MRRGLAVALLALVAGVVFAQHQPGGMPLRGQPLRGMPVRGQPHYGTTTPPEVPPGIPAAAAVTGGTQTPSVRIAKWWMLGFAPFALAAWIVLLGSVVTIVVVTRRRRDGSPDT